MRICRSLPLLACSIIALELSAATPKVVAPTPSAQATVALGMLNQYRAWMAKGDQWILELARTNQLVLANHLRASEFESSKFPTEAPMQPLVFNPALIGAAQTILAAKAKPIDLERIEWAAAYRKFAYEPEVQGLALVGFEAPSLDIAFAAAFTNVMGMMSARVADRPKVPCFAGREALGANWREVGIAIGESGGKVTVVMTFGLGSARWYIGGLVYVDSNRNRSCEPGEGRSGVQVSVGEQTMTTGASGAWWLGLPVAGATTVTFTGDGFTSSQTVTPSTVNKPEVGGASNLLLDWRMPIATDLKLADKLLGEVEKAGAEPEKQRATLIALLANTRMASLDEARRKRIDVLVEPLRTELEVLQQKVLGLMAEAPPAFKQRLDELKSPWGPGMVNWFKEAELLHQLKRQVSEAVKANAGPRATLFPPLQTQLVKLIASSNDPVLQLQFVYLKRDLDQAPPPPDTVTRPPRTWGGY